jgi:hypothetical protein
MTDVLNEVGDRIRARLAELQPAVDEYERVKQALELMAPMIEPPSKSRARSNGQGRRPARKRAARKATAAAANGNGNNKRAAARLKRERQLLKLIDRNPGITVSGVAKKAGITDNAVRGYTNDFIAAGRVVKDGPALTAVKTK